MKQNDKWKPPVGIDLVEMKWGRRWIERKIWTETTRIFDLQKWDMIKMRMNRLGRCSFDLNEYFTRVESPYSDYLSAYQLVYIFQKSSSLMLLLLRCSFLSSLINLSIKIFDCKLIYPWSFKREMKSSSADDSENSECSQRLRESDSGRPWPLRGRKRF